MKKYLKLSLALCAAALTAARVEGQATSQVIPRVYTLVSNQVLTSQEVLGTANVAAGVYASTNTFIAFSGAHALGLWATITSTNNVVHTNVVVGLTFAYDNGGTNGTYLNGRYGTNFVTTPIVWSFPLNGTTNVTAATNFPPTFWEPATSLAVAYVSNLCTTNITFQLQASVTP